MGILEGPGHWRFWSGALVTFMRLFYLGGGDLVELVDCCTSLYGSSSCRSILGKVLLGRRVDLQLLQGSLRSVFLASYLTPLSREPMATSP
ncbi:unnamed protein product [Schistocephalus solidus]|uniref:Uncharacterized protein n=1 Tax=Schistocephalus solidus TaxID=70667 RepID=A0A183S7B4_SCHSO|nr:unnamed protein product [Schistocephalus solidus]